MARSKVYERHRYFKDGREFIEDNERVGRPSTSRNAENVALVSESVRKDRLQLLDKNDNLRNPLKTPPAGNAISGIKLFIFPAKILIIEPVLPYILEEWISKNIPAKYR
ncbi:hypothetical protein TNCV_1309561 [Trichonephila clavipes]|nr:hypothetical protein TNCV_1309561 [Trichonephila clavipes]